MILPEIQQLVRQLLHLVLRSIVRIGDHRANP
jgi:hypothetical protein